MEAKSSERRYNTRFRGVPRSIFTYSRSKKSESKSNNANHLRTDIRDDFVYTKLGKKPNYGRDSTSPPRTKIKTESMPSATKQDKKSNKAESKQNSVPNGTHKQPHVETDPLDIDECPLTIDERPLTIDEGPAQKVETNVKSNRSNFAPKVRSSKYEKTRPYKTDSALSIKTEKVSSLRYDKVPPLKIEKVHSLSPESEDSFKIDNTSANGEKLITIKTESSLSNDTVVSDDDQNSPSQAYDADRMDESSLISPKLEKDMDIDKDINGGIFYESKSSEDVSSAASNGKPALPAVWIPSKEKLSWNSCNVASYNPKTKMFRCVVCQAVGFMSRIGEHYLGTHCNAKVFHCPQCSYCSAWWRCVRNHMSKNHGVSNAPASLWKNQPLLDEIMQILQNLKYSVDCEDRVEKIAESCVKRYICPKCPYATDRRDLYNRHENIHREEKPFQCYICYKLFNRADHVKKHFCRIHKEFNYDINLIRRLPSKRSRIPASPALSNGSIAALQEMNSTFKDIMRKPFIGPVTQSHLLNCLTGSPTLVQMSREIDNTIELSEKESRKNVSNKKNDPPFNKSHSNLLTFLTQPNFPPKPAPKPAPAKAPEPPKEILQEALLKPSSGYSSFQNSAPKKYSCAYCPWTGPNSWALRIHTSMHYKTFCMLCNFKSSETADLEKHMWEAHKKRSCNKCNFLGDNLLSLDAHMKEVHGQKPQFACRHCSQSFELRSDMEAHSIFIHNQVLSECKDDGCDFCTTDPEILDVHKKEVHSSSSTSQDPSASRTLCLYCGCDFADPQSLSLHEELFHENSLQKSGRRPLNPYSCCVCGYTTPSQPMMIEHMRLHSGQSLRCQAGDGCRFDTPYDSVLREHVLQSHGTDDGIVRCPHCGLACSGRSAFVAHYQEMHHPFCCRLCEDVEHRHFVLPDNILAMFPFAKTVGHDPAAADRAEEGGRRSRKQTQPRKVMVPEEPKASSGSREKFISLYVKKVRKIAQASLLKCRFCVKSPIYFRHKRNLVLHQQWHSSKKHQCNKCIQTFSHRYQVLLHQREHKETKSS